MQGKYGVDHALLAPQVREKAIRTCLARVGKYFPAYETEASTNEELITRYGVAYPLHDREYAGLRLWSLGCSSREIVSFGVGFHCLVTTRTRTSFCPVRIRSIQ